MPAFIAQSFSCAFGAEMHFFFLFFSFISLIADGPHHYHPACGHKGSSHLSPVHALQLFYHDASSAPLQLVNQWLNFTYSRSHAFRYERKNTNYTLVRIELTTSVLADEMCSLPTRPLGRRAAASTIIQNCGKSRSLRFQKSPILSSKATKATTDTAVT